MEEGQMGWALPEELRSEEPWIWWATCGGKPVALSAADGVTTVTIAKMPVEEA